MLPSCCSYQSHSWRQFESCLLCVQSEARVMKRALLHKYVVGTNMDIEKSVCIASVWTSESCHALPCSAHLNRMLSQYLRITREIPPNEIRPIGILKVWLLATVSTCVWVAPLLLCFLLQEAFRRLQGLQADADGVDYEYTCDQLKGIRQDLTLQGIRTG